ncbi:hypothetical protein FS749_012503 [Ceratobasidium sp. UAMH 11750]|nr:hypothetical protein FS749_012503 [Ceratobasidium sp. UAMH 11750]
MQSQPHQRTPSEVESRKAKALRASNVDLPKLKDGTYTRWSFAVSDVIESAGLRGHLDGSATRPDGTDPRALEKWTQEDAAVRSTIVGTLDHDMTYRYLEGTKTAKEAWDVLERHYRTSDYATLMAINGDLMNLRMPEGGDVIEHIVTLRQLKCQLDGSHFQVNEHQCKAILFRSLPPSYGSWVARQEETDSTSFDKLCLMLETQYRGQKARGAIPGGTVSAYPALTRPSGPGVTSTYNSLLPSDLGSNYAFTGTKNPVFATRAQTTCWDCLHTGHRSGDAVCPALAHRRWRTEIFGQSSRKNDCKNRRSSGNSSSTSGANPATVSPAAVSTPSTPSALPTSPAPSGSIETVGANVSTVVPVSSAFPMYAAYSAVVDVTASEEVLAYAASSLGSFLIDSGCQRHMTCVRSIFTHIEEFHPPVLIRGIGNHGVEANRQGTVAIPVDIDGVLAFFYLEDVLYAPELHRNLISTGALLEAGLHLSLSTSGAIIYSDTSRSVTLATAVFRDRLWILNTEGSVAMVQAAPAANVAATGVSWHCRLRHIGVGALRRLADEGLIAKLTKSDLEAIERCRVCILGKGARLPFPRSLSVTTAPLEIVHSNLCGPFDPTVGGARYTASFVDDFSRVAWVFLLKTKDEVAKVFMRLRAHVELFTGFKIKTLRSDGGGEYKSHLLADYLADAGILHQTSCPDSSQQNGVAERFQRTLFDRVQCMLEDAGMAWGWWGEAALTAVHIYNQTPHSALPNSACPLSLWPNESVSLAHIRVFGSPCFAIDVSKHRKKSASRATECRLLGYDSPSKAYHLQVKGSTKVIRSRDVIFHENASVDVLDSPLAPPIPADLDCPPGNPVGAVSDLVGAESHSVGAVPDSVGESAGEDGLPVDPVSGIPVVERPRRVRKKTWKLRETAEAGVATTPKTLKAAMQGPEAQQWKEAVDSEYASWEEKGVYDVVPRPEGEEVIPTILLLNRKTDETGAEVRKKARCVARGDMQSQSPDDGPTLASPVASTVTLWAMAALAARDDCEFQQMDVKTAFLHAPLSRPIYLAIPSGFPNSKLLPGIPRAQQVLCLNKAVYGLREAPASWYGHCTGILTRNGFKCSDNDHCLFWVCAPGSSDRCYVLVYVDDFTLLTRTADQMTWLKQCLASLFDLKDLGAANQVLGLEVVRDREAGTLIITQRKFARQLLEDDPCYITPMLIT